MDIMIYLVPVAIGLGLIWLIAFFWCLKSGQYSDLDGAAQRILIDDDRPSVAKPQSKPEILQSLSPNDPEKS